MSGSKVLLFASLGLFGFAGAPVLAADAANGERLADQWCAACHIVKSGQTRGSADVPPFSAIAAKFPEIELLSNFLAAPYPRMPSMTLSRAEIADLVAYIRTQGPPRVDPPAPGKDTPPQPPTRG